MATGYVFTDDAGTISGLVYDDSDGSGTPQPGEPRLVGATVVLLRGGTQVATTTTGPSGTWSFGGLVAGTYTVRETTPDGYLDGADLPGSAGGTLGAPDSITLVLPAGGTATDYAFGEVRGATVRGSVRLDTGAPLAGVQVTLTRDGDTTGTSVTTGSDGTFVLTGVRPGSYAVAEAQPALYGPGSVVVGTSGGLRDGTDRVTGVLVQSGGSVTGIVFTDATGSLTGLVYADTDADAAPAPLEPRLAGVLVTLTRDGTEVDRATTGADGRWPFPGLPRGTYVITETQPADYADGREALGTPAATQTGTDALTVVLPAGTSGTGYAFGEVVPGSVAGWP